MQGHGLRHGDCPGSPIQLAGASGSLGRVGASPASLGAMSERTLIVGGRVIDPASGLDEVCDVALSGGEVGEIGAGLSRGPADRVLDAEGCIVCPGLVDPHVHLREPGQEHKETIRTGSEAAVAGGFTTVCCMPNTTPALDSPAALALVRERGRTAACRVFSIAAATRRRRGRNPTDIALLAQEGAVGFSDDGDCIASAGVMRQVLTMVAPTGRAFMQHCQEPTLTQGASMHAGEVSARLGLSGWPRVGEEVIIERDIRLNQGIGCRYHVQHVSSAGSVEIVRRARAEGEPVTCEASPHHLTLTHEACEGFDTSAKMNPPVREQSDIDAIRAGVADGTITVLATDHAPHARHEKDTDFESAAFGIVGLETALGLYVEALVASGAIDWARLIALLTIEPARLCNLEPLGALRVGGPADVTIIDPEMAWVVGEDDFKGKSANSPFVGRSLRGRAVATIVGGEIRMRRERVGSDSPA